MNTVGQKGRNRPFSGQNNKVMPTPSLDDSNNMLIQEQELELSNQNPAFFTHK
jgi:hypothetical protein